MNNNNIIEKTLIIVPCYNAGNTIFNTIKDIRNTGFYNIVLSDDKSNDDTILKIENNFPDIKLIKHQLNLGYGGSQKSLYNYAKTKNFEYVIMIHGDNQYSPSMLPEMANQLNNGAEFVLASRFLLNPIIGGMPLYKFFFNRVLTKLQNHITNQALSEYHSGLRGYNIKILEKVDYNKFSNNFIFDNQMLLSIIKYRFKISEIPCETKYDNTTSSISLKNSIIYGIGVLIETFKFKIYKVK